MGKVLVFSLLVLASLRSASTEEKFIKEGGSVTLELKPAPSDPITVIQWKFKESILAEWVKDVLPLTHNREHILLDIVSGHLAMEKMTEAEEGVYSVEVNNNVQKETYNVVLIKDVPKPKIWISPVSFSDESDQCTLNCEGDTTGAEPVTYSWKIGDGEWKESRRDMRITHEEHGQVKIFTCKMKNPVSEKESDPLPNIFDREMSLESSGEGNEVVLIKDVPKPSIWVSPLTCSHESFKCTLTCEGDPWKIGDGNWTESERDMIVIKGEHGHLKTFTCKMKNPVSEEESTAHMILFLPADSGLWIKVLGAVMRSLALLALLGVVVFAVWRNRETLRKRMCPCQSRERDYENEA
ncbi:hypothetical protein F7725_023717 [Dissostichus mawsoni]|uniref:Uncharacterized protein n=1 Tax=Dissostichus mawsoni TaxID=36200 RepID=A0A7J5XXC2_DISMA|nr:hypothetical protein F7725_023717 [Dissostichus mawsoni]